MKFTFKQIGIAAMALTLTACSSGTASTDTTTSSADPDASASTWVYDGPGYDALYEDLGKADVDLSNADGKLKAIIDSGKLVMATSPDFPPSEFVDELTGDVKGSDVMLAQYIANSLGVELEVETMDFNAVLTAVDTGKADVGISGFGYKADRAEQFELSIGYEANSAASHHTLLVRTEDADKYNSLADFDGKKIDAQANSLQEMYVNDQIADAELTLVSTLDQALLELQSGKVDAVALPSTTAKNYAEAKSTGGMFTSVYETKGIEFDLSQYKETAGNVVACKKGETSLINAINEIIQQMMDKGLYADMYYAACDAAGVQPSSEE